MEVENPLQNFKYMGYCRVSHPPNEQSLSDLVRVAKSYLCRKTLTLWKAPIWDTYRDEEILIEYFSWIFSENKEFREEFELEIGKTDQEKDEIFDWLDEQVKKSELELEEEAAKTKDSIVFDPQNPGVE